MNLTLLNSHIFVDHMSHTVQLCLFPFLLPVHVDEHCMKVYRLVAINSTRLSLAAGRLLYLWLPKATVKIATANQSLKMTQGNNNGMMFYCL